MKRHVVLAMLVAMLAASCSAPDEDLVDARTLRDTARSDRPETGTLDAFSPGSSDSGLDASCGQTEPVPMTTVQCSPCAPQCFVTREMPGPGDLTSEDQLEHDASSGGLRLAAGADGRYPAQGQRRSVHDSAGRCDLPTELTYWRTFEYEVELPEGTSVDFEVRTGNSEAALLAATPLVLRESSGRVAVPLDTALIAAGGLASSPYLSITAVLRASPDGTRSPVLRHYDLRFTCVAGL